MLCRPFADLDEETTSIDLKFYSDASKGINKGAGCILNHNWTFAKWEKYYIVKYDPSIDYLELLALCIGVFTWPEKLANMNLIFHCDNETVEHMVNNTAGRGKNSMYLIRLLVLNNIKYNRKIKVVHVASADNTLADALSRIEFDRFWFHADEEMKKYPDELPTEIWPASKIWQF